MERLEAGLDRGWIPCELRELIEEDLDFDYQRIERHAWDQSTPQIPLDPFTDGGVRTGLAYMLRKVKQIWLNARVCSRKAAIRTRSAWRQSQAIAAQFLSSVPDASSKALILDRKADFTLSFSHMPAPGFEDLYSRLRAADSPVVSHMVDAFTKTTALFSCVEVKSASGDHTEAEYQLSIWMAASLRKKIQLARRAGVMDKSGPVEPCFAIVGHKTHVYFAYMASEGKDAVHIVGPEDGSFSLCETTSVSGIFRALRLWRNVFAYGMDKEKHGALLASAAGPSVDAVYALAS
ncbi:hypothetical protein BU25DRAFT_477519 [Macroventuria anomochaeta]|uniref:Uncharacterized protein n=1 Tax=Macroventuria anomochaeta TaxID=301207 RepID=A0ACB6RPT9_9PLEO|nr:uncharacterized protein BU25DRAFT_477519 [Macroventuria anomochaeta]KAF2623921.1 hypothetical protein BU25DRAFT_477519 [Macroventuria anomochaeta]